MVTHKGEGGLVFGRGLKGEGEGRLDHIIGQTGEEEGEGRRKGEGK